MVCTRDRPRKPNNALKELQGEQQIGSRTFMWTASTLQIGLCGWRACHGHTQQPCWRAVSRSEDYGDRCFRTHQTMAARWSDTVRIDADEDAQLGPSMTAEFLCMAYDPAVFSAGAQPAHSHARWGHFKLRYSNAARADGDGHDSCPAGRSSWAR
jgi:hypothetical protein